MKKKYMLIAHYVDSTATILSFDSVNDAFAEFKETKWHPDLAFVILYSLSYTEATYRVIGSFVSSEFRHSFEFALLGFAEPKTPAGQE